MDVSELAKKLGAEAITEPEPHKRALSGYAGDFISRALVKAGSGSVWITVMANVNVAAVAFLADVSAVILAEGVRPDEDTVREAENHGVNIYSSSRTAFELCGEIGGFLAEPEESQGS